MFKAALSRTIVACAAAAVTSGVAFSASAAADQTITAIFGSGNADTNWTTNDNVVASGIELALRAKVRHGATGAPENTFNSNGDGTYSFAAGVGPTQTSPTAIWSYEWSINVDADGSTGYVLSDLVYSLSMTSTTGAALAPRDPLALGGDHAFGNNSTPNGGGTAGTVANYVGLYTTENIAQQSWKPHWEGATGFDPTDDGVYTYVLTASLSDGTLLASTTIDVIVGNGAVVPTPSAALAGLFMFGGLAVRRRRRAD